MWRDTLVEERNSSPSLVKPVGRITYFSILMFRSLCAHQPIEVQIFKFLFDVIPGLVTVDMNCYDYQFKRPSQIWFDTNL